MSKFLFLGFLTINYDAFFDILFVNIFAFTNLKEVCNFNDTNPNRNVWIQKNPFLKMANSPVKNVRAEKSDSPNRSKMHRFSFQKIDLYFDH